MIYIVYELSVSNTSQRFVKGVIISRKQKGDDQKWKFPYSTRNHKLKDLSENGERLAEPL